MRIPAILTFLVACAPTPAPVVSAPEPVAVAAPMSADAEAALAVVHNLFDAMKTRDTAAIRASFDPNMRLYGVRMRRDSTFVIQAITGGDFINAVAAGGQPWIERIFDPEVRVSGPLAMVWTEYDFHAGAQFSHCGVDAVTLLKLGTVWKIVSIADTQVRAGCPPRPPLTQ